MAEAPKSTGIIGSQKDRRNAATSARNASKKRWMGGWMIGGIIFFIILMSFLFLYKGYQEGGETSIAASQGHSVPNDISSVSVSMNDWSDEVAIGVGCRITFSLGMDTQYRVVYRNYKEPYKNMIPGRENVPMSHVRFMAVRPDVNVVEYRIRCS